MGPEILAATALGTAVAIFLSAAAGWYARSQIADAIKKLHDERVGDLERTIAQLLDDAERSRNATQGVLDAANRRADHDSAADPLGIGLLLGPSGGQDGPSDPSGEAGLVGGGEDRPRTDSGDAAV